MLRLLATTTIILAAATAMRLQSADFSEGGVIPTGAMAADCGGQNRSPELSWNAVPRGVKSYALIVHDPDAPLPGGFYHWVVYNLPATTRRLEAGARLASSQLGETSLGKPEYYGPCPPPGPAHHYAFTLYALDLARIAADAPLSAAQLEHRIAGHVIATAALHGMASHR
jgi:Raf kinase inhibitor-like YbhB/YbcL family protein